MSTDALIVVSRVERARLDSPRVERARLELSTDALIVVERARLDSPRVERARLELSAMRVSPRL